MYLKIFRVRLFSTEMYSSAASFSFFDLVVLLLCRNAPRWAHFSLAHNGLMFVVASQQNGLLFSVSIHKPAPTICRTQSTVSNPFIWKNQPKATRIQLQL